VIEAQRRAAAAWIDALKAYDATLTHSPRRFNSVAGAMRAAERSGDGAVARRYARELLAICANADTERPEVTEAKRIASGKGSSQ
jgi:hypothetical protein